MFKKVTILLVLLVLISGQVFAYEAQLRPFSDLPQGHWAEKSIYKLVALGVISGYPDQSFRANEQITREAFMKLLISSDMQLPDGDRPLTLNDVSASQWSYPYIQKAYQLHLIDFMIEDNSFKPTRYITREEVAGVIGRYLLQSETEDEVVKWETEGWQEIEKSYVFNDQDDIDQEIKPYLLYAAYRGIMNGDQKGNFRPKASLTRGEAAAVIERTVHERIKDRTLSPIGFYAIKSFNNIDKMSLLDQVIFGWSNLDYKAPGNAQLNTKSSEYSIPAGWESAIHRADQEQIPKELMVYSDNKEQKLSRFLNDQAARQAFLHSLSDTLANESYGFTGVCIDFEGLKNEEDQAPFLEFLNELKGSLDGKSLTVAVPPITYYKGYDLKGISQVSDQVVLMAYDFTHKESFLPSAPLPLVNETVATALKSIPREKIILGISKQANQWYFTANGETQLLKPAIDLVEERMKKPESNVEFSVPYFLTKITYQNQGNRSEIWYEDDKSIEQKIWLAKYYGLKGISLWHMGNYTPADWKIVESIKTNR